MITSGLPIRPSVNLGFDSPRNNFGGFLYNVITSGVGVPNQRVYFPMTLYVDETNQQQPGLWFNPYGTTWTIITDGSKGAIQVIKYVSDPNIESLVPNNPAIEALAYSEANPSYPTYKWNTQSQTWS